MICGCRSTYDGCDLVPLATSSVGDSELIIHFQETYARLFSNCYNKQVIQSNLPPYRPMNQGTICANVYPEGVQPVKGNNCGLIPIKQFHYVFDWEIRATRVLVRSTFSVGNVKQETPSPSRFLT